MLVCQRRRRPNIVQFGWPPVSGVAEVTKARRETVEICWGAPNSPTDLSREWVEVRHIVWTHEGDIAV